MVHLTYCSYCRFVNSFFIHYSMLIFFIFRNMWVFVLSVVTSMAMFFVLLIGVVFDQFARIRKVLFGFRICAVRGRFPGGLPRIVGLNSRH